MIDEIKEEIDEDCSITSGDLVLYVRRQFNLNVSLSTIDRAIGSFNYRVHVCRMEILCQKRVSKHKGIDTSGARR